MEIKDLFMSNDIELYKNEMLKMTKKFDKLSKRMDRILKQGDRQQLNIMNLTEDLDLEKKYISSVINAQSNMVISTDGKVLKTANNAFLEFYNVQNINEFISRFGSCICDTFDKNSGDEFLKKFIGKYTWVEYVLKYKNKLHKAKIILNDIEYIFTITADTFMHNDEVLKVAVFNNITELEKTKNILEETNSKVNQLLNNAGQGFLYFDENMIIGSEYSKEALNIFEKELYKEDITKLLYTDESKQLFLKSTLQGILSESEIRQEILISLLEKEFLINNKFIEIEYKILENNNFMMILTDVTSQKELSNKIKEEQQVLKMVVETVTSLEQFTEIKTGYINFILRINEYKSLDKLSELRREIHTYKGLFAQKEMLHIVKELHEFENIIDYCNKNNLITEEMNNINFNIMNEWLEKDINILKNILGDDFFLESNHISIDRSRIGKLQAKIKYFVKNKRLSGDVIDLIIEDIEELKFNNVQMLFHPFEKLVEQLSMRFDKNINPLVLIGKKIYIPNKYKNFINSLVHIFRNSVDHGIENEEERLLNNKNLCATISCRVEKTNNNILINIQDDGSGIDIEKLKQKSIQKGIYTEKELSYMSNNEILNIIFLDEFSTSENITDISGRGVGLASVKNELNKLNGKVHILNKYQSGVEFLFTIPINCNIDNDIELLQKLSSRTISYYHEELNMNINTTIKIKEIKKLKLLDISVAIPLTNDMDGTVYMSVSNKHARLLINDFIDDSMDDCEIKELAEGNIQELLNITLGNILKDLNIMKNGGVVGIKIPSIINSELENEDNSRILISELNLNNENIILGYFI
jgi:two-component system chemotaxis sensor kinase CheA